MRELETPVARVFRRLRFQRFLSALVWSLAVAFLIVAVTLGAAKLLGQTIPGPAWAPFAIAGAVGLVVASLVAILSGPSRLDAAVAIDRAFHLNERLSTAITLPDELRETPAGQALFNDAVKKVGELDVTSAFGTRLPARSWVALVPALLAVAMLFVPTWVQRSAQAKTDTKKIDPKVMAERTKALTKKIAGQRQAIDKEKFPEADKLLAQIEKQSQELAKSPPGQKDRMLVEMNKLTDALKDRKKQLGNPEQTNRQLQQLKGIEQNGPADQFAKDLAKGDLQKAVDQMKSLEEKLKNNTLTESEKKALKDQLGEMSKKLKEAANLEERKKQLDQALKNGGMTKEQHEREMEKLQEQSKALQDLQKLASKLEQAQQAMEKGDNKQAAEAMNAAQQQLSEMAKNAEEMQSLDAAMADVQESKEGLNGQGMNQLGEGMSGLGNLDSMMRGKGNPNTRSRGRGEGDRAEAQDDTATRDTKVPQQIRKGKAVLQGFTDATKSVKGQAKVDIQAEMEAATESAADALSNQKIPKNVEKHIRSYYDQINSRP